MSETLVGAAGGTSDRSVRSTKAASAFRTISEVAEELDVAQHVLRFWESKFPQVRPLKRGGGRRYYRPEDIDLLRRIRSLLYDEGYTIKGVQKLLRVRRRGPSDAGEAAANAPGSQPEIPRIPAPSNPPVPAAVPPGLPDDRPSPDRQGAAAPEMAEQRQALVELRDELLVLAEYAQQIADQAKLSLSEP
ncbi:MerR family transcriptional regulator [Geminicoccus roseus]|uniref:MerR family transcriptional regulator n=1 Tax=Geminicoccus roseus TaxID=404900 RepID=UPI000415367F|nr:MerR family transcriptional regulator [Geminicoccus roseus]